jgi:DNA polymerase III alpha subunit
MKKLFMIIPILGYSLTYPDFSLCYKRYKNLSIIPISKHYSITSTKPKKFVKYDEIYGIYLIKTKNKHYLHFKKSHLGVWLASIKNGQIYSGNYAEYPKKDIPAKFSTKTTPGSIMSDIFCNPVGIGVNGGFLSVSQIKRFITTKPKKANKNIFKFLGIIVDNNLNITKIIPNSWADKHYLQVGAKIIKIDNQKVNSLSDIKSIPKNVTITFDINSIIWKANYKGR